jgi:hypothetical protein
MIVDLLEKAREEARNIIAAAQAELVRRPGDERAGPGKWL